MRKPSAYTVYLIMSGGFALFSTLVFTVSAIYRVTVAGLDPLQLVLVGTMLEGAYFLCEIPTGVVADVYSRRLSVIIGVFLFGVGALVEGLFPSFGAILGAQIIWALGYAFTSGAQEAWIADELGEAAAGAAFLRGAQAGQVGTLAGIVVSVALASLQLALPIAIGGALFIALGLFLVLFMPERGFAPTPQADRTSWQKLAHTFDAGLALVRGRPVLLTILGLGLFHGLSSEGFDRLWELHFLRDMVFPSLGRLEPIVWFGIINIGGVVLSIGAVELVRRRLDTTSHLVAVRTLLTVDVLMLASIVAFGLAGEFALALAAYWVARILRRTAMPVKSRRTAMPVKSAWVNQSLQPEVRATVLSMAGQVDALGQILGGPVLGLIASRVSVRAALVVTGLTLAPTIPLYLRVVRERREGRVAKAGDDGQRAEGGS